MLEALVPGCLEEMEAESWRVGRLTDWAREEQLVRRRPEVGDVPDVSSASL